MGQGGAPQQQPMQQQQQQQQQWQPQQQQQQQYAPQQQQQYAPQQQQQYGSHPQQQQGMQMTPIQPQGAVMQQAVGNISIQQVGAVSYPAVREGRALQTVETIEPYKIGIIYNAPIHESARYLGCAMGSMCNPGRCPGALTFGPCCDCIQFNSKLRPRMYAQVHENRIETNYPFTWCCGAFVCDSVRVEYFDKMSDSVKTETCCTPFHCCCCIECCGGVVAMAPMNCCNACYCVCFRTFFPGLQDANGLMTAIMTTRSQFREAKRLGAGSLGGPSMQKMSN